MRHRSDGNIKVDLDVCGSVNRAGQARKQWRVRNTSNLRARHSAGIVLINWQTSGSSWRAYVCQFTSLGDTFFRLLTVWEGNESEDWTEWNLVNSSDMRVGKVRMLRCCYPLPAHSLCTLTCHVHRRKTTGSVTRSREFTLLTPSDGWAQWPRGLRRGSAAARLLGLWVRIPRGRIDVCLLWVLCVVR